MSLTCLFGGMCPIFFKSGLLCGGWERPRLLHGCGRRFLFASWLVVQQLLSTFYRSILVLLNSAAPVTQTLAETTGLLRCLSQGMKGIGQELNFKAFWPFLD